MSYTRRQSVRVMKMLQFNNRGILMKNVMGIIIAVIGLAIFFAGVYGFYQVTKSQTVENARKTLDSIMGKIELLQDGENNTFIFQGPKGWFLTGWSKEEGRLQGKPDKCFDKSCVCICSKGTGSSCQNNGFCRDIAIVDVNIYTYTRATDVETIRLIGSIDVIKDIIASCIIFPGNLADLFILRNETSLIIFDSYGSVGLPLSQLRSDGHDP